MDFFDLMKGIASPAGTRWAALLYGADFGAPIFLSRGWND
jgi:hypothetical protein